MKDKLIKKAIYLWKHHSYGFRFHNDPHCVLYYRIINVLFFRYSLNGFFIGPNWKADIEFKEVRR